MWALKTAIFLSLPCLANNSIPALDCISILLMGWRAEFPHPILGRSKPFPLSPHFTPPPFASQLDPQRHLFTPLSAELGREACSPGTVQSPHPASRKRGFCYCMSQCLLLRHKVMWLKGMLQQWGLRWLWRGGLHPHSTGTGVGCSYCCHCCRIRTFLQFHQSSSVKHKGQL